MTGLGGNTVSGSGCSENQSGNEHQSRISVLVVSDRTDERTALRQMVGDAGLEVMTCPSTSVESILATSGPDVAVICVENNVEKTLENVRRLCPETPMLITGSEIKSQDLVSMIRGGACDFVEFPCPPSSLIERLHVAVNAARQRTVDDVRIKRLMSICKRLTKVRREMSGRLDELERDLESSQIDMEAQRDLAATTAAFRALISQELGVEDVLRTAIEYMLKETGPTNAAVFLASSETEYTLGAYVSYECTREQANPVLNRLALDVCAHVAEEGDLVRFQDVGEFVEAIGPDAEVLRSSEVVAVPCLFEGECLAVVFLFRDQSTPFAADLAPTLDALRDVLGEQLATVVRVHHRLDPDWPENSYDDSESEDCSDWGFGEAA